jgi:hypothetical protein
MKNQKKLILLADEIQKTIERLHLRIRERFPESNLANVCQCLYDISTETHQTVEWISKPNYVLRYGTYVLIAAAGLVFVHSLASWDLRADGINLADFVQMIDSALNSLVLLGAGILFLVTLENRRKRHRVIHAVNHLRCIAHIVDMHQLTKDPDSMADAVVATPHSPRSTLNRYELARYLDYCTEMLALVSKTAFLYVQDYHDPVATEAVNDLEDLTNGLASKMWQKIVIIQSQENGGSLTGGDGRRSLNIPSDSLRTPGSAAGRGRSGPPERGT